MQGLPILIAGGGIAGLACGIALARAGHRVQVLERREAFSEAGAGIQIGPNGVRALDALGVRAHLAPCVGRPEAIVVREGASARQLARLPLGDWIEARHGAPYWVAHRRDLQAALLAGAAATPGLAITTGFDATFFTSIEGGAGVHVHAADGTGVDGAALVGADGLFSRVRAQLVSERAPRFAGRTAARAVVPATAVPPGIDPNATTVWIAADAHVVHYPVRAGQEMAIVVVRSEAWRDLGWSVPVDAATIAQDLAGYAPLLRTFLAAATGWRRWALFEADPLPVWSRGNVTLAGDAAHPVLPFLAQGGVMALEDAVSLAAALPVGTRDVAGALQAYGESRWQRTGRIVDASRRNGQIFHLSGLPALARNAALAWLPPQRAMARYDWVYGWRPPASGR